MCALNKVVCCLSEGSSFRCRDVNRHSSNSCSYPVYWADIPFLAECHVLYSTSAPCASYPLMAYQCILSRFLGLGHCPRYSHQGPCTACLLDAFLVGSRIDQLACCFLGRFFGLLSLLNAFLVGSLD